MSAESRRANQAFTLLEVLITLSILVTLIYTVAIVLRNGFDVRNYLGREAEVTQKMNLALESLSRDLSAAFIIKSTSLRTARKERTRFVITKGAYSDSLAMTYNAHQSVRAGAKESDISFVRYEVKEDSNGHKHLYRGETPRVPDNFDAEIPMEIVVRDIASLTLEAWTGDDWSRSRWDSSRGTTKDKLPKLVRVTVKAWEDDPEDRGDDPAPNVIFATAVYLPYSLDYPELKDRTRSFKIN